MAIFTDTDLDSQPSDPVFVFHFQTRENFNASRDDIKALSKKMLEVRQVVSTVKIDALGTQKFGNGRVTNISK